MITAITKTSLVVCRYLKEDERKSKIASPFDTFPARKITYSTVFQLIQTMYQQAFFQPETLIAALVNLNRFRQRIPLNRENILLTLQICLDVSCKGVEDISPGLKSFATKGQDIYVLVRLERYFCQALNYNVIVDSEDYNICRQMYEGGAICGY